MKFKHNGKDLHYMFSVLNSIVPPVATRPILQSAQLRLVGNELTCCATDLEVGVEIKTTIDHVEAEGEFLMPVAQLSGVLREYQSEEVTIEIVDGVFNMTAKGDKYHFMVNIEEDFPDIPFGNYKETVVLPQGEFKNMVGKVAYAVCNDPSKAILGGVMIEVSASSLKMAAADGHRMAFLEKKVSQDSFPRAIVPRKTLKILSRTLEDQGEVTLGRDESHLYFVTEKMVLVSRLIEGSFPDVENFIPKKFNTTLKVDKKSMADVLKKSTLVNSDREQSTLFKMSENGIHLSTYGSNSGGADFDIEAEVTGEPLDIVFNPRFILETIDTLSDDNVVFSMISNEERVLIKEGQLRVVIMPISHQV